MNRLAVMCCLSTMLFIVNPSVRGQPTAPDTSDTSSRVMEEIIVSAPKRSARLEDVPTSITVVGSQELQDAAIDNVQEMGRSVPGLVYPGFGAFGSPTIRGVQTQGGGPNSEPSTALYLDGLLLQARGANMFDLPDVEQIEVLKGPQGTIAGRNALGGAIFINTLEPGNELRGSFSARTGKFDGGNESFGFKGFISGPLLENKLSGSFAAGYNRDTGYIRNDTTGGGISDAGWSGFARGKLRYEVDDNISLLGTLYATESSNPTGVQYAPINCARTIAQGSCVPTRDWHVQNDTDAKAENSGYGASLRANVYTDFGEFTSLTGYLRNDYEGIFDSDGTSASIQALSPNTYMETISQEINFASREYDRFSFVTGASYYDIDHRYDPLEIGANHDLIFSSLYSYFTIESLGVYGEAEFFLTDRITLVAGTRWTREEKTYETGPTPFESPPPTTKIGDDSWEAWTPRYSIRYELAESTNVYLTYSEGFRSGQFSNTSFSPTTVEPEILKAFELGVKVVRHNLRADASVYTYDLEDIQAQAIQVTDVGGIETTLQNAASGDYLGAELDIDYSPVESLDLKLGVSYLERAEFEDFPGASVVRPLPGGGMENTVQDLSGRRIPLSPKVTASAGFDYMRPFGEGTVNFIGNFYYSDSYNFEIGGFFEQPSYTTVNARVDWHRDNWTYSLWGKNLTNEAYSRRYYQATTLFGVSWAPPREIGLSVSYDY